VATASQVWENTWLGDAKCQGAPTQMTVFDVSDTTASAPSGSESWPSFYAFVSQEYTMGTCGNLNAVESRGCCYSTLDKVASSSILSGSHEVITSASPAPASAN
ncbi:hypothetical protein HDU91_004144, partial [Kappamyces sp. JEL0680]